MGAARLTSELLLWRVAIPADRKRMNADREAAEQSINLKPPITPQKVADAIAHLSLQVMRGELDAASAKTSLYALQTLLTALRLQMIDQKKTKDTPRTKARKPARRRRQIAKSKR